MSLLMLFGGPAAALVFGAGITWLGIIKPGYSSVRQTISELGPLGETGRKSLSTLNLIIASSMIFFSVGLLTVTKQSASTNIPAYFVGFYAILLGGLAAFPSRHPLHNVFGLLQTLPFVGAPLALALGLRGQREVVTISWVALSLLVVAIVLNIAPLFSTRLTKTLAPVYGSVQRSLFVAWYGWCACVGGLLLAHV